MKPSMLKIVRNQASQLRRMAGLSNSEAVSLNSLLLKLNVLTVYRPLSDTFSGMSLKSGDRRFMLINSNQPLCRQHFTLAHELYHLYFDPNPMPHNCMAAGKKDDAEQCADAFALLFLMPTEGVWIMIPDEELMTGEVSLASVLRIEQYFAVSHTAAVNRLFDMKMIDRAQRDLFLSYPIKRTAREYGYGTALYEPANENTVIGDFGEKARHLFDEEKISEGHYLELLHKIGINDNED